MATALPHQLVKLCLVYSNDPLVARTVSKCLPFLAYSSYILRYLLFAIPFYSSIFSFYSIYNESVTFALTCLFGRDSIHRVKDLFVEIDRLILLSSFRVYLLYFLYSRFVFLSDSS